jgi:hypothetical protein
MYSRYFSADCYFWRAWYRQDPHAARVAARGGRAARPRTRILHDESLLQAARRLVARIRAPRTLPEPRLARALTELGLPAPAERLSGSRPLVRIVPVTDLDGTWRSELRALAAEACEATICLWIDEAAALDTEHIASAVEAELAAAGTSAEERDVLVVVAPLHHAPRERFVTSSA